MNIKLLKKLCETPAVPGCEDQLRAIVKQELKPYVSSFKVDVMGNVIACKKGKGKRKVMIAAHMDEIGFMVKYIDDKGFLRLQTLGGFDPRQLFSQRVIVQGKVKKTYRGVLSYATKPSHLLTPEETKSPPELSNFFVDLGLSAKDAKKAIEIGAMVTMDRTFEICGDCLIGKALDNRLGLFVMLEALKSVQAHEVDIYPVATVQEEIGLRGAGTSAFSIEPDIGIALDVTIAGDIPGMQDADMVTRLGAGTALKIMDSSHISHPRLVDHFKKIAVSKKIPHQMEILPRGGTDGGAMQRMRSGAVSMTLSIPTRYIHTVNEMANRDDIEASINLLAKYLEEAHTGKYSL